MTTITKKMVRDALRRQYGARGYRVEPDGRVMVHVRIAGGDPCWMPFGSTATPEEAAALAAHPLFQQAARRPWWRFW
jgi:hypothetical protein